ncbi:MAG: creatininase family protein [Candidatus Hadarchaeum sp.]|uniref:creatininase family protein n=1 Tax=Candidatus Hadarchaeum sp. TaxID=2883567 RepID=UPI0031785B55
MYKINRNIATLPWPEVAELLERKIIIVPLGSVEQHGPHLPLATDAILAEVLAQRVAEIVDGYYFPPLPYGQVWSAQNYPGTISLKLQTMIAVIKDIAKSLYKHKVKNLVFISSHIGNVLPLQIALRELYEEISELKIIYLCYPQIDVVIKGVVETPLWAGSGFHAGEVETSLLLAVAPELCRMEKAVCEYPPVPVGYGVSPIPWERISKTGVFGDAKAATAEKGVVLLERWTQLMANIIKDIFKI